MSKEGYFSFSEKVRHRVKEEQQNLCAYCGSAGCLEVHHIVPSSQIDKMGWSIKQIKSQENAVALCGGEDGCHNTFDNLAQQFGIYFDDVMEDEGRRNELAQRDKLPAPRRTEPERRISRFYMSGDD